MPIRINRYFTDNGYASRREADKWVEAGRVFLNGKPARHGDQVNPGDRVELDGKEIAQRADKRPIVVAYNKPPGIECTTRPDIPKNIIAAVNHPERLFPIGRLDVASEGLILLTNQGNWVNQVLRSHYEREKEYVVVFREAVTEAQLERLRRGVEIGDDRGPTKPCRIRRLGRNRLSILLTEGRNRQIRRMAEAVGLLVVRLKRIRVLSVELGELKKGHWRELTPEEIARLTADFD